MSAIEGRKIDSNLSIYLDLLRLGAAVVVFLSHAHIFLLPSIKIGPLGWGREAVAIFFVLSGFVISYIRQVSEKEWRIYLVARIARIMPVALLAIAVIFVADSIGMRANAFYYDFINTGFFRPISLEAALAYVTFTNQLWFVHAVFGSGEPYRSLGFEVQYYLFFGLFAFSPRRAKVPLLCLWAAAVGPKILMYMPLWLMGWSTMKWVIERPPLQRPISIAMIGASLALFVSLKFFADRAATNMYETWSLSQEATNFVYFNLIGLAVVLHLIGAASLLYQAPILFKKTGPAIKWLAGGSFTLYLVHQPLILMFASFLHPVEEHIPMAAALLVACFILCFLLAEVAERRKKFFASLIVTLLPTLAQTSHKTPVNTVSDTVPSDDAAPSASQLIQVFEEMQNALDREEKAGDTHDAPPRDRVSRA
ncbi:peptidoglycan/LPS O-acetylase OafA/YrhL [Rhizobium sp. BK529]|uniref:acyltransferase family protein n=1 Tax=Rhizobium sp. BK529 TaxID=2586983 RepID=UPI00160B706D|nr:acyltransferase [Rhizobium sp. BK529]MBB3595695.1 peptidoglycan/LPS O-acetylase OafA/YrhL [Rhizobium sp. BK529]